MRTVHGNLLQLTRYLSWAAQHALDHGRLNDARRLLGEGLELMERSGERYWQADLLRLRGLLAGSEEEAEADFLEALAVARAQGAAVLELRAACALARLWAGRGRGEEARALLAGVYGAFTEGWTVPDLRAARELLAELEAPCAARAHRLRVKIVRKMPSTTADVQPIVSRNQSAG